VDVEGGEGDEDDVSPSPSSDALAPTKRLVEETSGDVRRERC